MASYFRLEESGKRLGPFWSDDYSPEEQILLYESLLEAFPDHKANLCAETDDTMTEAGKVGLAAEWQQMRERLEYCRTHPETLAATPVTAPMTYLQFQDERKLMRFYAEARRYAAVIVARRASGQDGGAAVMRRILALYTDGLSNDKFKLLEAVVTREGRVAEKLENIDHILRIPLTASAATLGELLGVTATSIKKTPWWDRKRKGARERVVEGRKGRLRARSQERDSRDND